jgi:hypothetical protein
MTSGRCCANSTGCCKQIYIDDFSVFQPKLIFFDFSVWFVFLPLKLRYAQRNLPLNVSFTFYSSNSNRTIFCGFDNYFAASDDPYLVACWIPAADNFGLIPNLNYTPSISSPQSCLRLVLQFLCTDIDVTVLLTLHYLTYLDIIFLAERVPPLILTYDPLCSYDHSGIRWGHRGTSKSGGGTKGKGGSLFSRRKGRGVPLFQLGRKRTCLFRAFLGTLGVYDGAKMLKNYLSKSVRNILSSF